MSKSLDKRIEHLIAYPRGINRNLIVPADWHITPEQPEKLKAFNMFCGTKWKIENGKVEP